MERILAGVGLVALLAGAAFSQSTEPRPKFEVADVHTSPSTTIRFGRGALHGQRYEFKSASMLDLVSTAYSVESDKVLGGPTWLEMDRFEVIAKAPAKTPPDTLKLMLQSLLAERFNLTIHQELKPMPAYALVVGKRPQLKESDGSGETGCKVSIQGPPGGRGADEPRVVTLTLTLTFSCHNMTMAAFAEQVRDLPMSRQNGSRPVVDRTELKGAWNFDLKYDLSGPGGDGSSVSDALDKQLGLKLEEITMPMTVIEVQSVNQKPTANPPEVMTSFPPLPGEFDVSEIKPSKPDSSGGSETVIVAPGGLVMARRGRGGVPMLQNGRVNLQGFTLKSLITLAWNLSGDNMLAGAPKWVDADRFDVIAKTPGGPAADAFTDLDSIRPLLRTLLLEHFKMAVHTEDKPADQYVLTAAKPKLKKADPAGRTKFFDGPGPDGKDPRIANPVLSRLVTCQNMTLAQFASLIPNIAGGYIRTPVLDETGIEGAWDFTLSFSPAGMVNGGGGRGGRGGDLGPPSGDAADPGGGLSLFEAVSKQLGLKLAMQKRPLPVLVIDHVEQPTDN
jgi:uncharacterized protein (TIGR03435 family)